MGRVLDALDRSPHTPKGFGNRSVKQGFFYDGLTEHPGLHAAVKAVNGYQDEMTPEW